MDAVVRNGSMNNKEVHFEDPATNSAVHGRHSIATSHVPLLPPVSSASHVPKQSFRATNPSNGVNITAYFEQCRNVNEQLRRTHDQERKAWEIERTAMQTRIADLEFRLNKSTAGRRRLSNDMTHANIRSLRSDFSIPGHPTTRPHGHTISNAPLQHLKQHNGKPIWEPSSPIPATRVFAHDDDVQHLPGISEDNAIHPLSREISNENKPIPIQQIDETLDGITVKSEGVKSSFIKIMSPIIVASPGRSPSPMQRPSEPPSLRLDPSNLLDPLDAKLKRNAGHTPLVVDTSELSSLQTTGGDPTPREEKPPAPVPTARPPLRPSERSDSYFSTTDIDTVITEDENETDDIPTQFEPDDDRPLSGPLMLDASGKSELSHTFLDQLDQKLEEEVRKSLTNSPHRSPSPNTAAAAHQEDDDMPQLRLKQNKNFGSAYGSNFPGICDR